MQSPGRRLLRALPYVAAGVVITLALLVGVARLLLPRVPDYQDDIRAWASAATGYDIGFQSISASWPLSGPELTFIDVRLTRPGEPQPVITAREFSIGLSIFRSLRDRSPRPGHVAVRGTRLRVERVAGGALLVQGRRLEDLLPARAEERPELDLELADIAVTYVDAGRQPREIQLDLRSLVAAVGSDHLAAEASIGLPQRFGRRLDLEIELPMPLPHPLALPPDWTARVNGTGLDLPKLLAYASGDTGPLRAGGGDLDVRVGFRGGSPAAVSAEIDLKGLAVGTAGDAAAYERLSGRGEWRRVEGGWDASVKNLRLRREGRDSPATTGELRRRDGSEAGQARWTASAGFLRLDDLFPLARAALAGTELEPRLPRLLRGDLRDAAAEFVVAAGQPTRYTVRLGFVRLGLVTASGEEAVSGLSGTLAADGDGGRLEVDSRDVAVTLAQWFRDPLPAQSLQGLFIWRSAPEGMRLLSDDIRLKTDAIAISSRLELLFPADGSSPVMDLKAHASATEAPQVLRYLPLRHFPPGVVDWLERAVVAGRVPTAEGVFRGPLHEFPFDHGQGLFRVSLELENGTLDYANGWPRVENLDAEVVFEGPGMYSTRNQARLGNLAVKDYVVRIPDLRQGILAVSGQQRTGLDQVLDFVRATPVVRHIGPTLARTSAAGPVDAAIRLALPVTHPQDYDLKLLFDARGCRLGLARLPLDLKDLRGRVRMQNTRFYAEGVQAEMLGEPVRIGLVPDLGADGVTLGQLVTLAGATPVPRVTATFGLPLRQYLDGRLDWQATVRIPEARQGAPAEPLTVALRSDLRGVSSSLPAPLAKDPAAAWSAAVGLAFPTPDEIDVNARLDPPFSAALRLVSVADRWRVDRGALRAGPGAAELPARRGVEVSGRIAMLRVGDWLALGDGGDGGDGRSVRDTFREFAFNADQVSLAGQVFRNVQATVRRGTDAWQVTVRSPGAEGQGAVPFDAARPITLDMKKLWLGEEEAPGDSGGRTDPRSLMALDVKVADAAIGQWRLGELDMAVARAPDGLVVQRLQTRAPSFQVTGGGAWRVLGNDPARQETHLDLTLESTDVKPTLEQLGFGAAISGKSARVTVDLTWAGAPAGDFLKRAAGGISVEMKSGQVADLEPGSGRLLGLLSVTALPRRLSLDFRDVFDKGLGFDSIKGSFRLGGGNGYTCNLGVSGPAAEIAIVGRTGFGDRDYDQVAVVRPQLATTVLTAGGAVLGGPVGGVTMLLISQLFRKPLGSLGESYYRVTGGWDKPEVTRVQRADVDAGAFKDCEKEIEAVLPNLPGAVVPGPAPAAPPR